MVKKAIDGIQDLLDRTGGSKIKATVTVDQPYAQDQHETLFYKHASGGQAKYLEQPLMSNHPKWLQQFANRLLVRNIEASNEWAKVGRALKNEVPKNVPIDFGDLRQSAALTVKEGGSIVTEEPAAQPRLTEGELDAKDYMRSMGVGYR